jgi:dipeptidase E
MRLLLTSEGITNSAIAEALVSVAVRPVETSRVAFVPTSANLLNIDKRWLLTHMSQVEQLGFGTFDIVDIVDIVALPPDVVHSRLAAADVLVFGGGDTAYLMRAIEESGITAYLAEFLESRLYVGISAGSIVAGPDTTMGGHVRVWNDAGIGAAPGYPALGYVTERVRPHLSRPDFPEFTPERIERVSRMVDGPVYALDDDSALLIADEQVSVVGTGTTLHFG